jgi:phosphoribosyl 1,2-cyclic phosphodiesterase
MRFASLGSGSEGNALVVESTRDGVVTRVLLDCGFALKEAERRLARLGLVPDDLDAIVVTHEHGDHVGGVFRMARRYQLPVWLTHGTAQAIGAEMEGVASRYCHPGDVFSIADITILPYAVPHDAREPVQFVFSDGAVRLGVLTDAGRKTAHIVAMLSGCDALVLECNHDAALLDGCDYPPSLKWRIKGDYGHLANHTAAEILDALDRRQLKVIVAAHLSRQNNSAELARAALSEVLRDAADAIVVATQDDGLPWTLVGGHPD